MAENTIATSQGPGEYRRASARAHDTMASRIGAVARAAHLNATTIRWPSPRWKHDIVGFAREVLGVELWAKQQDIASAIQEQPRVAVSSGHKIGKSLLVAVVALWYYCSHDDARVIMMSTTARQVERILWREVRRLVLRSKIPIDGDLHELARSGLISGLREIVGFTASDPEAAAGVSGTNMLFIFDEASGIDDKIWETMTGNTAGGARVMLISNPTRTDGFFFNAFHGSRGMWKTFVISSEEAAQVNMLDSRGERVPLATPLWILERKQEWGEDSPAYKIRVKGEFALGEDSKICGLAVIRAASERHETAASDEGPLRIGLDPAGEGGRGDFSVFAIRRGLKIKYLVRRRGLSIASHLVQLSGILREERKPREVDVAVIFDREGPIGWDLLGALRPHAEANNYRLVGVRTSDRAVRMPKEYMRVRDELWANVASWLRSGAIPPDEQLQKQLHAASWELTVEGRLKATAKEDLRIILGSSPDDADALALAVWEPTKWEPPTAPTTSSNGVYEEREQSTQAMDPYGGLTAWR